MAFNGIFFQFGTFVFPNKYIKWDSFRPKPCQRQDLDSFTDGNGVTHRNALEHTKTEIQFSLVPVSESVMDIIMTGLTSNYINPLERDANCLYYDMESRAYKTGHFYMDPSFAPAPRGMQAGKLLYGETPFLFIEY